MAGLAVRVKYLSAIRDKTGQRIDPDARRRTAIIVHEEAFQ